MTFTHSSNRISQFLNRTKLGRLLYRKSIDFQMAQDENAIPPKTHYYNETLNDRWIVEYVFPYKTTGFFLEAGAANGREASSCYILEKEREWTGICIEPNDFFFNQLIKYRPNSICENVCLSDKVEEVVYIEGSEETISPYLSGIKENLELYKYQGRDVVERGVEVKKQAVPLAALLEKHNAPAIIDYAAFDIEGSELKVLEVFPFEQYTFLALTLECDSSIWSGISNLLSRQGYREIKNPFNRDKPWERYWLHKSI